VDFFERYLGISGRGDGSLEVMFLVVLVSIIAGIGLRLSGIGKIKEDVRKQANRS
jgi:hypothetical protein